MENRFDLECIIFSLSGLFYHLDTKFSIRCENDELEFKSQSPYCSAVGDVVQIDHKFQIRNVAPGTNLSLIVLRKSPLGIEEVVSNEWTVIDVPPFSKKTRTCQFDIAGIKDAHILVSIKTLQLGELCLASPSKVSSSGQYRGVNVAAIASTPIIEANVFGDISNEDMRQIFRNISLKMNDETGLNYTGFEEIVNKSISPPLKQDKIKQLFSSFDDNATGNISQIEVTRRLMELSAKDNDAQIRLAFEFIAVKKDHNSIAKIYQHEFVKVLDDMFAKYSYRSKTSRSPEVERIVACIMQEYGTVEGNADADGAQRFLDEESFNRMIADKRFSWILSYFRHLVAISKEDEPVCVVFSLPQPWIPKCMIPSSFSKPKKENPGGCVIV